MFSFRFLSFVTIQWNDLQRSHSTLIDHFHQRQLKIDENNHSFFHFDNWLDKFIERELEQRLDGLTIRTTIDLLMNHVRPMLTEKRKEFEELVVRLNSANNFSIERIREKFRLVEQKIEEKFVSIGLTR